MLPAKSSQHSKLKSLCPVTELTTTNIVLIVVSRLACYWQTQEDPLTLTNSVCINIFLTFANSGCLFCSLMKKGTRDAFKKAEL